MSTDALMGKIAARLEVAWDAGNAKGLDGWTGPERGSEPDDHAIQQRARIVDRLTEELEPTLVATAADAWDKGYTSGHSRAMRRMSDEPNVEPGTNPYRSESQPCDSPRDQEGDTLGQNKGACERTEVETPNPANRAQSGGRNRLPGLEDIRALNTDPATQAKRNLLMSDFADWLSRDDLGDSLRRMHARWLLGDPRRAKLNHILGPAREPFPTPEPCPVCHPKPASEHPYDRTMEDRA